MKKLIENYEHLEIKKGVCGGRPVIKNTRIEPIHLAKLKIEDILEDFEFLKLKEVNQALEFYNLNKFEYEKYLNNV